MDSDKQVVNNELSLLECAQMGDKKDLKRTKDEEVDDDDESNDL